VIRQLARIALALASIALCLLLAEGLLRVLMAETRANDRRGLHEARPDRPWLYGLRPGAVGTLDVSGEILYRINSDGFRDGEYARPKPEGVFRILVLGDSVAFGYGVDQRQSFPKQMEEQLATALAAAKGERIEVLNLGVSGYNPYTQLALLEDVGPAYQPDLVLVQFCINDLNDPTLHFDVQTRLHLGAIPDAAYPDPRARRAAASAPGALLRACRRSRVCSLLDDALLALRAEEPGEVENRAAAVPVEGEAGPEWRWLEQLYLRMAGASEEMAADFAVLAFPYPAQLEGAGGHVVSSRLVELGQRHGWHTVDPLESFRAAHQMRVKLFLDWWHPTPAGHRLASEETLESLACAGRLPEGARSLCEEAD
jgi:hypothetical protein